jgi:ribosomal protein L11 methyltransferase
MIAAAKLEASRIWGVDTDEVAVAVTRQNLRLNGVQPSRCRVIATGLGDAVWGPFNVVASNILSKVIVALTGDIRRVLAPDGVWIASGITAENRRTVVTALTAAGFAILEVRRRENWVAVAARRAMH